MCDSSRICGQGIGTVMGSPVNTISDDICRARLKSYERVRHDLYRICKEWGFKKCIPRPGENRIMDVRINGRSLITYDIICFSECTQIMRREAEMYGREKRSMQNKS